MQITRQADYGPRAILYLAGMRKNERVIASLIAKHQNIPPPFLAKIISQLCRAGLLHTSRGAHGGVVLAGEPKDITLLDVIEAIDGVIQLNICARSESACSFEENCRVQRLWCEAQNELIARLQNTIFAQLTA